MTCRVGGKALWTFGIIAVPFLGVFLYLIVNGESMTQRAESDSQAAADAQAAYIRDGAGTAASPAAQLGQLADLHAASKLSDDESAASEARVLAGPRYLGGSPTRRLPTIMSPSPSGMKGHCPP